MCNSRLTKKTRIRREPQGFMGGGLTLGLHIICLILKKTCLLISKFLFLKKSIRSNHQPISVADFGRRVNDVRRRMQFLQNVLFFFNFGLEGCLHLGVCLLCIPMFIIHILNKFQMPSCNGSLVTANKQNLYKLFARLPCYFTSIVQETQNSVKYGIHLVSLSATYFSFSVD